ncbi:MAG: hypothetical protein ACRENG_27235, partial [bacterium]
DLPGGRFHSEALGISDDGKVIIGRSSSARFEEEGFFRTVRDSLIALQGPAGAPVSNEPRAMIPNGEIIAGKIASARGPEAARWTAATGWVGLGDIVGGMFASQSLGISIDGTVIVGWGTSNAGFEATRWVNDNALAMGDLPGGGYQSAAALVSSDGKTIVGTGYSAQGPEVFVWKESTGMIGLGDLAGGQFSSEPFGMTPDASVIVGEASSGRGIEAFRWTQARGMEGLGDLSGGTFHSIAFDVSVDGAIVVGFGNTAQGSEAFIWDATNGMRNLKNVLVAAGLREVEQWRLTEATGISADGRIIVGKVSIVKRLAVFVISFLLACSQQKNDGITNADQTLEYSSAHFKFHLTEFDHANIASIAQHLENNYSRVTGDLSASNLPIINIQLYSNQSALHQTLNFPNSPAWLVGAATARDQIHMMSPNAPNLNRAFNEMLTILVHEFTHCVTLNIAPSSGNNPRWLWEGVVLYQAGQFVHP